MDDASGAVPSKPVQDGVSREWNVSSPGEETTASHIDGDGLITVSQSIFVPSRYTVTLWGRKGDSAANSGRVLFEARSAEDTETVRAAVERLVEEYDDHYRFL